MPFADLYRQQAALLIRVLPHVAREPCFALKGGTAINLFVRDMPRLSVDIDLTYLPVEDRGTSLAHIDAAMKRVAERIRTGIRGARDTGSAEYREDRQQAFRGRGWRHDQDRGDARPPRLRV